MKVVVFANNRLAVRVVEWVVGQGAAVAALVLNAPDRRKCGDDLIRAARVGPAAVFDGAMIRQPAFADALRATGATLGLSVLFSHRIPRNVLDVFAAGAFNLHPAYLPYNRGADPNVWSIVEHTPAGTTLHWMDADIDTGDIVLQRRVDVRPWDNAETLYPRLEDASFDLFVEAWPMLRDGRAPRLPQVGEGTCHRRADLAMLDAIDPDRSYRARDLIDWLRARSFHPYRGATVRIDGRRVRLHLDLEDDEA